MDQRSKISAQTVALSGLLAAVCLVLLYLAGITPAGWIGVTAVAGLAVAVAVSASGRLAGLFTYLVASILGFILIPGKHIVFFFLCLFGLYPLLKLFIECCKKRLVEYLLKLIFFNVILLVLFFFAYSVLFQGGITEWFYSLPYPAVAAAGSVIFLLYDYAFTKVMAMLQVRLVPQLRDIFRGR